MKITSSRRAVRALLLALPVFFLGACTSIETDPDPASAHRDLFGPWTAAFHRQALLVADEVRLEGPADLLGHVAIGQDPDGVDYRTETTTDGLLQVLTVKPGHDDALIRAQLDGWQLVALRRFTVLQRPGDAPVVVQARGDASWATTDGAEEQRDDFLEFIGERGK